MAYKIPGCFAHKLLWFPPSAPWVNYVSFKYFVLAEYSPLNGVYCVEIQHPPRPSFPLHGVHMCASLSLPLSETSGKEKSNSYVSHPKNTSSHNRPPPQEIRSSQGSGQKKKSKTTTEAGAGFFSPFMTVKLLYFYSNIAEMFCIYEYCTM